MPRVIKTIENVRASDTFDVADYPACKLFVPVNELSGTTLVESVSETTMSFAAIIGGETIVVANGAVTVAGTLGVAASVASNPTLVLPDVSSGDTLLVVVGSFIASGGMGIGGTANDPSISVGTGTNYVIRNTVPETTNNSAVAIDGNTVAIGIYLDRVSGTDTISGYEYDSTTITRTSPTNITGPTSGFDLGEAAASFNIFNGTFYGFALFNSVASLTDAAAIVGWCNSDWRAAAAAGRNKVLPPWLKGRT